MTKQSITKVLLSILISLMEVNVYAYDIAVENTEGVTIYYNYINDGKELEVTKGFNRCYSDIIVIPEEVTYMNRTRKVTSIDKEAFSSCFITSVAIPKSISSIGEDAFSDCYKLTSVYISDLSTWCNIYFENYSSNPLGSGVVTFINNEEIKNLVIPNNVTSIAKFAFHNCRNLTSIVIPNSVTSIGKCAFQHCQDLTTVTIGNNVTLIDDGAFSYCLGLTTLNIPNSVKTIGSEAFKCCYGLSSVTIPNSVSTIGPEAFQGCIGLASLYLGKNITAIGQMAFEGSDITIVTSQIERPFEICGNSSYYRTFSKNTFNNATLYVPVGSIYNYKGTDGWKDFLYIEEGIGPNSGDEIPESKKCAMPTISYQNGKLIYTCATEGATCLSTITDTDIKSYSGNEVPLGVTYQVSVYATKEGYNNSDVVTATLCWIDVEPKTEGIENAIANVRAKAVMIQNNGSSLIFSGVDVGANINVFDMEGKLVGSEKASASTTIVNTSLHSGEIGIVMIGKKAIKILMK